MLYDINAIIIKIIIIIIIIMIVVIMIKIVGQATGSAFSDELHQC